VKMGYGLVNRCKQKISVTVFFKRLDRKKVTVYVI